MAESDAPARKRYVLETCKIWLTNLHSQAWLQDDRFIDPDGVRAWILSHVGLALMQDGKALGNDVYWAAVKKEMGYGLEKVVYEGADKTGSWIATDGKPTDTLHFQYHQLQSDWTLKKHPDVDIPIFADIIKPNTVNERIAYMDPRRAQSLAYRAMGLL